MARKNISFNFLDQLSETLHFIADDSKAVKGMTCNRTKGTCLLTECLSVHAHEKLVCEIMQARGISILCDKATDITMNKIFCVNVRFLPSGSTEPVTKLYRLLPVENGKADGLFESLKAALEDNLGQGCLLRIRRRAPHARKKQFLFDENARCGRLRHFRSEMLLFSSCR